MSTKGLAVFTMKYIWETIVRLVYDILKHCRS